MKILCAINGLVGVWFVFASAGCDAPPSAAVPVQSSHAPPPAAKLVVAWSAESLAPFSIDVQGTNTTLDGAYPPGWSFYVFDGRSHGRAQADRAPDGSRAMRLTALTNAATQATLHWGEGSERMPAPAGRYRVTARVWNEPAEAWGSVQLRAIGRGKFDRSTRRPLAPLEVYNQFEESTAYFPVRTNGWVDVEFSVDYAPIGPNEQSLILTFAPSGHHRAPRSVDLFIQNLKIEQIDAGTAAELASVP